MGRPLGRGEGDAGRCGHWSVGTMEPFYQPGLQEKGVCGERYGTGHEFLLNGPGFSWIIIPF